MVISELIKEASDKLLQSGNDNSRFEALHLVGFTLKMSPEKLITNFAKEISKTDEEKILNLVKKRNSGVPFQYLLGTQEFMSLEFSMSPDVLIPRQDTETLVEFLLKKYADFPLSVLDIGTGTGCIPISLAHFRPKFTCIGIDISENAVNLAKKNADALKVSDRVTFEKCDILKEIPNGNFNIVTSNPPYIKTEDIQYLQKEVRDFEPHLALDGGVDGLKFYRRICDISTGILKPDGILVFEIGFNQADIIKDIMKDNFKNIEIVKDLCKNDRLAIGYLKKER